MADMPTLGPPDDTGQVIHLRTGEKPAQHRWQIFFGFVVRHVGDLPKISQQRFAHRASVARAAVCCPGQLRRGTSHAAKGPGLAEEFAELNEQLGWKSSVAHDLVNLAAISSAKGDFATADRRLGRAQRIAEDIGLAELVPVIVFNRGEIARDADNLEAACSHWLAALPMMKQMGSAHVATAQAQIDSAGCGRALADQ